ncbi:hypothetical protein O3P69_016529 [Scylla paramamosain]|uniref:Uncharacterized protein n=1 Tax=Scylla paramamosain TaxID=85552 RepID=A0AAW0TDM4_SCYPA
MLSCGGEGRAREGNVPVLVTLAEAGRYKQLLESEGLLAPRQSRNWTTFIFSPKTTTYTNEQFEEWSTQGIKQRFTSTQTSYQEAEHCRQTSEFTSIQLFFRNLSHRSMSPLPCPTPPAQALGSTGRD